MFRDPGRRGSIFGGVCGHVSVLGVGDAVRGGARAMEMSEVKAAKLGKVARLRKRLSDSLGRLACE